MATIDAPTRATGTRWLDAIERAGNRLPHPVMLFLYLSLIVALASALAAALGAAGRHPGTGEEVRAMNLISGEGLRRLLTEMPRTFTAFPPLGTVLVAMLGIGVAERVGLIGAALGRFVERVPRALLPAAVVFAGIMSSVASDAGYVVLVPLGAAVFAAAGRHPIAGLAAAFAGVSGGFGANLLISSLDPLLAGITQTAAQIIDPAYTVEATANYYLMAAIVPLFTIIGALITTRVLEPRLGVWEAGPDAPPPPEPLGPEQRRGLRAAGWVGLALVAVFALLVLPAGAPLRDPATGAITPFFQGIVAVVAIAFLAMGIAFGRATGKIRSSGDVIDLAADSMRSMALYMLLAFVAAHFIAFVQWSNLGVLTAISGADALKASGLGGTPLLAGMVVVSALINLIIGSASAKWAVLATVFVPMFMLVGITPEATQAAYRIGDSVTNIIAPTLPYFPLILVAGARYVKGFSIGSLVAAMLPYSLAFAAGGLALLLAWLSLGLPVGPGAPAFMAPYGAAAGAVATP